MRKILIPFVAISILLSVSIAGAAKPDIPAFSVPLFPGTKIRSTNYYRYEPLTLKLKPARDGKSEIIVSGNYWSVWGICPEENQTIKTFYMDLAKEKGEILSEPGAKDVQFRYDGGGEPAYVSFHAQSGKYSLKIVRPSSLPSQVVFGNDSYADRSSPKKNTLPEPPVITDFPDSKMVSLTYNDFNKLKLKYKKDGQKVTRTFEGRYWHKTVKIKDTPTRSKRWVTASEINKTFRSAVLAAGGEVLSGDNRELVFHISPKEGGQLWASLWPQDGKYSLKIIQEKAMDQVLSFDADDMMARLDALGVLTLDGIYFDTAKATLKPESDKALQAALKLMTEYPDLVVEVGGHTDNIGTPESNETLSRKRASSVLVWLVNNGIDSSRLQSRGYGEASPVKDNNTDAGRSANRRVELKKISGGQIRDVLSLIKPYPGSRQQGVDEKKADYALDIYELDQNNKARNRIVKGAGIRRDFKVMTDAGTLDKTLSGVQIRRNYIQAVEQFGGKVLAEVSHGLYFRLDNLDGTNTFVSVWAPGATYTLTAVTVVP